MNNINILQEVLDHTKENEFYMVDIIKNGELVVSGNMNEFVKDGETLESVFMEVVSDGSSN